MLSNLVLILFLLNLIISIIFKVDIVFISLLNCLLFYGYTRMIGHTSKQTFSIFLDGFNKVRNVIIIFIIIGALVASWRFSGTMPYIIYKILPFINPKFFILATFLSCSIISLLIGSSFGTAASIGVVCSIISKSMDINEFYIGGAILSGIYLGDRGSPMSASAYLVSSITDTDIYINIKNIFKTGLIPFLITCLLYGLLGTFTINSKIDLSILDIFMENFNLSALIILPALVVVLLCLFKIEVKKVMIISTLTAIIIGIFYQGLNIESIIKFLVFGYSTDIAELDKLIAGGGIMSMFRSILVVGLSSACFGVFSQTEILDSIKEYISNVAIKSNKMLITSISALFTSIISTNQTLSVLLLYQLTNNIYDDKYEHALNIVNSAVVIAPTIPWNISMYVPLIMVGIGVKAGIYAFFLYIVAVYNLLYSLRIKNI